MSGMRKAKRKDEKKRIRKKRKKLDLGCFWVLRWRRKKEKVKKKEKRREKVTGEKECDNKVSTPSDFTKASGSQCLYVFTSLPLKSILTSKYLKLVFIFNNSSPGFARTE